VDASYDNLLGLNDTLTLGYNVNTDDHPMRTSQSSSVKISIPYQKGSWTIGHSHQDFARTIQGINQNYNVAGNSRVTSLGVERLLHRDQQARAYVYGKLERKRSRNYIEDYEIETQRRNLTVLSAGVRGDKKYPDKSKWEWQVGGKFGIGAFNAMKDIPGPAVSRFELITLNTTYTKPIQDGRYTYIGTFSAQGSKRELPGSEQFGAGGRYDVRGFHEDSLYGNTGAFLRNTFEAKPLKEDDVELTPYIGWDIGWVDEPATTTWSKPLITGAAIGSRLKWGKNLEAEATYTHALKRPSEFTATRDQIYLNATLKF
jgi:hemolysin activation/secretion protein